MLIHQAFYANRLRFSINETSANIYPCYGVA